MHLQPASQRTEERLDEHVEWAAMVEAVSGLSAECRRVLTLRKVYGWQQDRIAKHLGVEGDVVERHLRAGVVSLARLNGR